MPAQAVIDEARRWLDVPYHHQGRVRAGVDCVGLIVCTGLALGVFPIGYDYTNYGRVPTGELEPALDGALVRRETLAPGCVVSIRWYEQAHHIAIVGEQAGRLTMIHSLVSMGRVREHGLAGRWVKRIVSVYGFPGVDYEALSAARRSA